MIERRSEYLQIIDDLGKQTLQVQALLSPLRSFETVEELNSDDITNGLWAVADIVEAIRKNHDSIWEKLKTENHLGQNLDPQPESPSEQEIDSGETNQSTELNIHSHKVTEPGYRPTKLIGFELMTFDDNTRSLWCNCRCEYHDLDESIPKSAMTIADWDGSQWTVVNSQLAPVFTLLSFDDKRRIRDRIIQLDQDVG